MSTRQPYPGLRPFDRDEADIFFGREEQTDDLLSRLNASRFLAIVGTSGCGKSSLVRAGMIPALETGFMAAAGSRWQFVQMRPGSHPICRLATALVDEAELLHEGEERSQALGFLNAALRRGPMGLIDALRHTPLPPHTNLLILVDQFEEIFRFRREGDRDEADAFVALLLASAQQRDLPVYVVLTMRSDFIGSCALFNGLPEALNQSQYLTPRLSREQQHMAIVGPARVFGGEVEPELVNALLNAMGTDPDQLPLLQHLLMRLWHVAGSVPPSSPGTPYPGDGSSTRLLTMDDYEAVGGLQQALSNHLNEAYGELDGNQRQAAEILFRRLSERGTEQRDIRRPTVCVEIEELIGIRHDQLVAVVEIFRAPDRSFLTPRQPEEIFPNTVLDIAHECLIRQWDRLRGWAREEARSAETYRLLERAAQRKEEGEGGFYRPPELEAALAWREREQPSPVWARRYGGDFAQAMRFLAESEQVHRSEEARAEERRRKELRRNRVLAWAGGMATVLLLAFIGFSSLNWVVPHRIYCKDFTKQWGKIVPIGRLPSSAVSHRSWTIRLTSKGWSGDIRTMEVIDARHQLTPNHFIGTYLTDARLVTTRQEKESRYELAFDRAGRVVSETAFDRFGRMVWGAVHAPYTEAEGVRPTSTRATYLGPDGHPQPQGRSRAEFVAIRYDTNGFEEELRYTDRQGRPMPGPDNAFGQQRIYDSRGREIRRTSLNERGQPMVDKVGNAVAEVDYDPEDNIVASRFLDTANQPTLVNADYASTRLAYDRWGRMTEQRFFGLRGEPVVETGQTGAHWIVWQYDDRGNVTHIRLYDAADAPMVGGKGYFDFPAFEQRASFTEHNRLKTVAYFDQGNAPLTGPEGWHGYRIEYDQRGFVAQISYFDQNLKPVNLRSFGWSHWARVNNAFGQPLEERFFDQDNQPVTTLDGGYHLRRNAYDPAGNCIAQTHFDVDDQPVADKTNGAHRVATEFDRFRNPVMVEYFAAGDMRINTNQGVHRQQSTYDDYGGLTDSSWYDKDNRPANGPDGVHHVAYAYDQRGMITRMERYDAKGQPAVGKDGMHKVVYDHNDKGQEIKWQAFALDDKPAEDSEGNHLAINEFDPCGREIRSTRLRADNSPNWDRQLGIATRKQVWDRENRWIEQAYYDAEEHLVMGPFGAARQIAVYQADGREEIHRHFGANGQLVYNPLVGYAELRLRRGDNHTLLSVTFWGSDGSPINGPHGYHRAQQAEGSSEDKRYFDAQNHEWPALSPEAAVPIIYITEITDIKQPAAKAGLHAGDVLWQYGDWSFAGALEAERAQGNTTDPVLQVWQAFWDEVAYWFWREDPEGSVTVPVIVIRDGQPVRLTLSPLPQDFDRTGLRCDQRMVPSALFEAWKAAAAK